MGKTKKPIDRASCFLHTFFSSRDTPLKQFPYGWAGHRTAPNSECSRGNLGGGIDFDGLLPPQKNNCLRRHGLRFADETVQLAPVRTRVFPNKIGVRRCIAGFRRGLLSLGL